MNTTSTTQQPARPDLPFAALVADIIDATRDDATISDDQIVERITDAYSARISIERGRATAAEDQAAGLLARDRALSECTQHLKATVTLLADNNARVQAHLGHRVIQAEGVRALVERSERAGHHAVLVPDLRQVLDEKLFRLPTNPPTLVGVSVDHTHTGGLFRDPAGNQVHHAFIGWGVVVHSIFQDTTLEPVFRIGTQALCQTAMAAAGYHLERLL